VLLNPNRHPVLTCVCSLDAGISGCVWELCKQLINLTVCMKLAGWFLHFRVAVPFSEGAWQFAFQGGRSVTMILNLFSVRRFASVAATARSSACALFASRWVTMTWWSLRSFPTYGSLTGTYASCWCDGGRSAGGTLASRESSLLGAVWIFLCF